MKKTIEALDNFMAWYLNEMQGFMAYDFQIFSENHWMSWTVLPAFIYGFFMLFKYTLLWGIITMPIITAGAALRSVIRKMLKTKKHKNKND